MHRRNVPSIPQNIDNFLTIINFTFYTLLNYVHTLRHANVNLIHVDVLIFIHENDSTLIYL